MNRLRAIFLLIFSTVLLGACGAGSEPAPAEDRGVSDQAAQSQPPPAPFVEPVPLQPEEGPAELEESAPAPLPQRREEQAAPVGRPDPAPVQRPAPRIEPRPSPPPPAREEPAPEAAVPEYEPPEPVRTPRRDTQPVIVPSPPRGPESTSPADPPRDVSSDAGRTATPPPPRPVSVVVPEGTPIEIRLAERLDSSRNQSGDRFQAILERDLEVNGQVVAARGSRVVGTLEDVDPGGRVKGRAEMTLYLNRIETGGDNLAIETNPITIQAESSKAKDAKTIGIASGIGAAIGAIAGGKKGAAIGAAIGGGAGAGRVLTSRGEEAVVEREQLLSFRLEREIEATVR